MRASRANGEVEIDFAGGGSRLKAFRGFEKDHNESTGSNATPQRPDL